MRLLGLATLASILTLVACSRDGSPETTSPVERPSATPVTSARSDPAGDAVMKDGTAAPGYLDVLRAEISRLSDGTFTFTATLAEPVPAEPPVPKGYVAIGWSFCIDTDRAIWAKGFPFTHSSPMPCELIMHTRWDGSKLSGLLIDRRPLQDGGKALQIPLEPVVQGSSLELSATASQLGDPPRFRWATYAEELGEYGTDTEYGVDAVPHGGIFSHPATWPSSGITLAP
jgi:hypothetical protein